MTSVIHTTMCPDPGGNILNLEKKNHREVLIYKLNSFQPSNTFNFVSAKTLKMDRLIGEVEVACQ